MFAVLHTLYLVWVTLIYKHTSGVLNTGLYWLPSIGLPTSNNQFLQMMGIPKSSRQNRRF